MSIHSQVKHQKTSNKAALKYFSHFENHRRRQTELVLTDAARDGRICILGAGNCYDFDLPLIVSHFSEVHLVDIDKDAVIAARSRLSGVQAKKIYLHAPVDISGAHNKLESWRDMRVTPEALIEFPDIAAKSLLHLLPAPFDCVVSSCLISQILLTYRHILGEHHPLFDAGLLTLLIAHLRSMVELMGSAGEAFWITDISSDEIAALHRFPAGENGVEFLNSLIFANQIFSYLNPRLISDLVQQDPFLSRKVAISDPIASWLWHNGPSRTFMVYASRLTTKCGPHQPQDP